MKYTVIWDTDAEAELAAVWIGHPDRAGVTASAAEIERALAADAPNVGESRDAGRRIVIEPPLAAIFRADEQSGQVLVLHVWGYG